MRPILMKGHERPLTFLRYNRDGDMLFSCAKDHTPTLWYADNGERHGTFRGHNGAVWCCDVSRDSLRLITGSADQSAKLWDVKTGQQLFSFKFGSPARSVDFALGDKLAVITTDPFMERTSAIHVKRIAEDPEDQVSESVLVLESPNGRKRINRAVWGPLNQTIVSGGEDAVLRIWDAETGKLLKESDAGAESIVKVGFLGFARGFRFSWFGLSSCDGGAWRRMFQLVLKIRCAVFQIFFLPETGERLSDSGLSTYPRRLGVSHPFSGDRRASEVPLPRGVWFLLSALACCEGWWWSHVDVLRLSMASPVQLCRVSLSSVSPSSWFRGQCSGRSVPICFSGCCSLLSSFCTVRFRFPPVPAFDDFRLPLFGSRRRHMVEWLVYSRGLWVRSTLQWFPLVIQQSQCRVSSFDWSWCVGSLIFFRLCKLSGSRRCGCLKPGFLLVCFHCYYRIHASSPRNGLSADGFGGDLRDSLGLSLGERDRSVGDGGSPQRCGPSQSLGSRSRLKKEVSRKP